MNMNRDQQESLKLENRMAAGEQAIYDALAKIFKKNIAFLTLDDKRFLQARRSYLDEAQTAKYQSVLKEKLPRPDGQVDEEQEKLIDNMVRSDLETMATNMGFEDVSKKAFKTNADLVAAIKAKQQEELENK